MEIENGFIQLEIIQSNQKQKKLLQMHHQTFKSKHHKRFLSDLQSTNFKQIFQHSFKPLCDSFSQRLYDMGFKAMIQQNNVNVHEKIFTYIILVICFQNNNDQSLNCIESLYQLIQKPQFQINLPQYPHQLANYTQINIKSILSQYLNEISSNKSNSAMESLNKYPFVLQIFVFFFKTLLQLGDIYKEKNQEVEMIEIYEFLSTYFQIQFTIIKNSLYFRSARVYIIKQAQNLYYMFYAPKAKISLNQLKLPQSSKQQLKNSTQASEISQMKIQFDQSQKQKTQIQEVQGLKNFVKSSKKIFARRISIENQTNEFKKQYKIEKETSKKRVNFQINEPIPFNSQKQQKNIFNKKDNFVKNPYLTFSEDIIIIKQKQYKKQMHRVKSEACQNLLRQQYYTKQLTPNLQLFYRPLINYTIPIQIQNLTRNVKNKNITKQFTNSLLLQAIPEPYKSGIKATKQKARKNIKSVYQTLI